MPDPILPHPGTTWLEFGQTCDGYYCKNLAPGLYSVTGELWAALRRGFEDGGLYPYTVSEVSCDVPTDTYIVRVEEP